MSRTTVEQAAAGTSSAAVTSPTSREIDQSSISAQQNLEQQPRSTVGNANHPSQSSQSSPNGGKPRASVAAQQKSNKNALVLAPAGIFASVDYSKHTDEDLHDATVAAIAAYQQKREEADNCAYDVLIPALNQIIERYKQQGRATAYRLNGCPRVEEYFESIGLNYSTVRSWKSRAQQRLLQAAADAGIGEVSAYKTNVLIGTLKQDVLITNQHRVFSKGPVHSKMMNWAEKYRTRVKESVGNVVYRERDHWDDSLNELWFSALCRLLIGIHRYRHGGAVLISDDPADLAVKYSLQYPRLRMRFLESELRKYGRPFIRMKSSKST